MSDVKDQYSVGYGKPPTKTRFKKGSSGNPNGRPKGARNRIPRGFGLDASAQPANQMLLEEAYRTITVREGEELVELPVIKAVFRSLGVSAMKGNRLAQATMAELVREIEEEERAVRTSLFDTACEYKFGWERAIEDARKNGRPEPTPLPHPADVIVNLASATVTYAGPITHEEKARWDRMLEYRAELQAEVSLLASGYKRLKGAKPPIPIASTLAEDWKRTTDWYDELNEPLPIRYRRPLDDRFDPSILVTPCEKADK
ncbi:DUF5681 domain-containing protein [Pontixanthobacter sp. CEM42]|uniref:DUF5681 domain-containing protein n=1 Tax=Pontixanthobacter sp. CEM42 TaxID=2792077 RepID=UPI001ADEF98D|nr:DUF5681 domain-containing protein [Pontixanthobacter sp. CEM42]